MAGANPTDILWLLVATILVILMQGGFLCLESGFVRAKNGTNVAIKNMIDFCVSSLLFWAFGFALMFGASWHGLVGTSWFLFDGGSDDLVSPAALMAFFFFQLAFCSTSTTIVSGAVAERMHFSGYFITSAVLSGLIYPLFGHWAWGGAALSDPSGWLVKRGFIDFAGSTVVHSVGGWVSLAAILVIGPRLGRYGKDGHPVQGHNIPMAALGTLLLWVGWFGFNGGSTLRLNDTVPPVLVHTLLAGAAGGIAAMGETWLVQKRPDVGLMLNGMIAGLVAITAPCAVVHVPEAVAIGAVGGLVCVWGQRLLDVLKIDDAVGAIPAHLCAGIWGTLAVALLGDPELWGTGLSRLEQTKIQLIGIGAAGALSFTVAYLFLIVLNVLRPLRVKPDAEAIGLNVAEHGASSALHDLLSAMTHQRETGDFSTPVAVEPGTEAGVVAGGYNLVLNRFNNEVKTREAAAAAYREAKEAAEIANASKSQFLANMSHELRTPLNAIIGFSEVMRTEMFGPMENARYKDYIGDIHRSSTHLLSLINDILDLSKIEANKFELHESEMSFAQQLDTCHRIMLARAREEKVKLVVTVAPHLPNIRADARAVKQIILNLLSNAIKFTPEKGEVHMSAELEPDGRIALVVADTGKGMRKEDIPRALEPFTQIGGDSSVFTADGTGLGLPLTVALVRLHGGTIVIDSAPGKGTRVTVRFPETRVIHTLQAPAA